jgi:hypothetical protein
LYWEDISASFEIDGSLKTVQIDAAGSEMIWQALMDWVCTRGPDSWYTETGAAGPALRVPAAAEVFERRSRLAKPHLLSLNGWLTPGIRAWLVFSQPTPVWFLISQEDIQSQADLGMLIDALAALGRRLGHGVSVAHEHDPRSDRPILRYDPATDTVSWS